jgi:allantoinase
MTTDLTQYPRRRYGMDHDRYDWSMLQDRAPVTWPDDKPLALWINISLQHFPLSGEEPQVVVPGALTMPYPDLRHYTLRDYGNRIGIYRVLKEIERTKAEVSFAINGALCERYPALIQTLATLPFEWLGHSWDMLSIQAGNLASDKEADWIHRTIAALERAGQRPIKGWLSPGRIQTDNTPELLALAGLEYHCDWVNDELPYRFRTHHEDLICLPSCLELDDVFVLTQNLHSEDSFEEQIYDAANTLISEARALKSGRLLCLNFHPWLIGQPHRILTLRRILNNLLRDRASDIWNASPSQIIAASKC